MADVVILSCREDQDSARRLAQDLASAELNPPLILNSSGLSENATAASNLVECKAVICLWSNAAAADAFIFEVASTLLAQGKLVLALVEQASRPPTIFALHGAHPISEGAGADRRADIARLIETLATKHSVRSRRTRPEPEAPRSGGAIADLRSVLSRFAPTSRQANPQPAPRPQAVAVSAADAIRAPAIYVRTDASTAAVPQSAAPRGDVGDGVRRNVIASNETVSASAASEASALRTSDMLCSDVADLGVAAPRIGTPMSAVRKHTVHAPHKLTLLERIADELGFDIDDVSSSLFPKGAANGEPNDADRMRPKLVTGRTIAAVGIACGLAVSLAASDDIGRAFVTLGAGEGAPDTANAPPRDLQFAPGAHERSLIETTRVAALRDESGWSDQPFEGVDPAHDLLVHGIATPSPLIEAQNSAASDQGGGATSDKSSAEERDQRRGVPEAESAIPGAPASSLRAVGVGPTFASSATSETAPRVADNSQATQGAALAMRAAAADSPSAAPAGDSALIGNQVEPSPAQRATHAAPTSATDVTLLANGAYYAGAWRNGKPHGQGVMLYPNGIRYRGQFADGEPTGQGVFTNADGGVLQGSTLFAALLQPKESAAR